jgi:hypothetical protein
MIRVLSSSRPCVTAHSQSVSHDRCHTRGATIVVKFVDGEIVRPTSVPAGAQLPAR